MESRHHTVGRHDEGLVTARLYEDGDLVVCHGARGNVENIKDVSGYGPIMNMCDRLDIRMEVEEDIIDFVRANTGLFE